MALLATLLRTLLPNLTAEVVRALLNDLRAFARSQVTGMVLPSLARLVTKGIDGFVKVFARHLEPVDAHRVTHGVVDEFQRQAAQFVETLRVYADAAYQVEAAKARKDADAVINGLRATRERLKGDVEDELRDMFAVLTGGTPED